MKEKTKPESRSATTTPPAVKIAIIATYAGLCVGAGYMLALIPNVEIFTMLVFLGGLLFGKAIGSLVGFIASILYFIFNLYGASPIPLLVVQLVAYTVLGFAGGFFNDSSLRKNITRKSQVVLGIIGASFAFGYTIIADLIFSYIMGINFWAWVAQGSIFTGILVVCNAITFSSLLPLILVPLDKHMVAIFSSAVNLK
nr:hypothetical protein [Candidatus Sigynarchaeota archaeon]